jgi:hypothetical protein
MTTTAPPIALTGSQLGKVHHICPFFSNDDEEFQALLPFVKVAPEFGAKAVHGVNHHRTMSSRDAVIDIMRTIVIVGGTLRPNLFFPSAEFRSEYQQPRA